MNHIVTIIFLPFRMLQRGGILFCKMDPWYFGKTFFMLSF